MGTKVGNLSELSNILRQKDGAGEKVLAFSKQFNMGQLLSPFSAVKKQGYTLMSLLVVMILSRFWGLSIYASQKTGYIDVDDNTVYLLMNNPFVD